VAGGVLRRLLVGKRRKWKKKMLNTITVEHLIDYQGKPPSFYSDSTVHEESAPALPL
jgi:hypothetical protein